VHEGEEKVTLPTWKKIVPILVMVLLWGCGYQLVGKETHLPPGITSVAIPTFVNRTYQPGIEVPFTQAFLDDFIRDKRIKVVDRAAADSVLEGTIHSYRLSTGSTDQQGFVSEYRATVVVDLALKRPSGEVIWKENNLSETRWFRTSSDALINEASQFQVIRQIASLVAERVRNRFFYNF
jgi:outer membrane lipopolysaccharide assembly protein LptE/RlpB